MKEIVQKENPVLKEVAKKVLLKDIKSKTTKKIISDMHQALATKNHGVALAGPQIGKSLRIFVVSGKIFDNEQLPNESLVYINPEIIKTSKKTILAEEGCLSVSGVYGKVDRAFQVTVTAYNEKGEPFTRGASGLLAHIFQHEIDHLNGILFTDKAKEVYPHQHDLDE